MDCRDIHATMTRDGGSAVEASSSDLVERCRAGSEEAWRALFDAHVGFVARVARRLGTPADELEDVCQETFVVVSRKLAHFTHGRFTTWLYRIIANIVRARGRRRRVREVLFATFARDERSVPTPERLTEQKEIERAVADVLSRIAVAKREVFVLYEIEGWSGEQIAESVGAKLQTVWTRLHYARKDFARLARERGLLPEGGT
jgi:RNA polymerase sigma-70 factor (ECF subfamily)